jgi:hypothetical protein
MPAAPAIRAKPVPPTLVPKWAGKSSGIRPHKVQQNGSNTIRHSRCNPSKSRDGQGLCERVDLVDSHSARPIQPPFRDFVIRDFERPRQTDRIRRLRYDDHVGAVGVVCVGRDNGHGPSLPTEQIGEWHRNENSVNLTQVPSSPRRPMDCPKSQGSRQQQPSDPQTPAGAPRPQRPGVAPRAETARRTRHVRRARLRRPHSTQAVGWCLRSPCRKFSARLMLDSSSTRFSIRVPADQHGHQYWPFFRAPDGRRARRRWRGARAWPARGRRSP